MARFSVRAKNAAAGDFVFSFQDNFYGFGIDAMLFLEDFVGEGGFRVFIEDRDSGLQNDGAGIEVFVDEMDGAASEFHSVFEGLALGFEAGEGGEQRGVNIQDAVWKFCNKEWGEQAHVASEAGEF